MEKFIAVSVTDEQTQLVSATGILLVEQASTTTVQITYKGGAATNDGILITHAAISAGAETMRDWFQNAVVRALQTTWANVSFTPPTPPAAISAIAVN